MSAPHDDEVDRLKAELERVKAERDLYQDIAEALCRKYGIDLMTEEEMCAVMATSVPGEQVMAELQQMLDDAGQGPPFGASA